MLLSEKQRDALTELINIAFSRSAASLSELTRQRILFGVPSVKIITIDELVEELTTIIPDLATSVHQLFSGPVAGDAMLILSHSDSRTLVQLLLEENPLPDDPVSDSTMKEVLIEVGNILLNSCLGMFGNILKIQIRFSVPEIQIETLGDMIKTLSIEERELNYAMMISAQFNLRNQSLSGYLVIVLGVTSLDKLIEELEKL